MGLAPELEGGGERSAINMSVNNCDSFFSDKLNFHFPAGQQLGRARRPRLSEDLPAFPVSGFVRTRRNMAPGPLCSFRTRPVLFSAEIAFRILFQVGDSPESDVKGLDLLAPAFPLSGLVRTGRNMHVFRKQRQDLFILLGLIRLFCL